MPLYVLIVSGFLLTLVNYYIGNRDILHPSVIFCGMNFIYSSVCLVIKNAYGIDFHSNTMAVLVGGMLIFTLFNMLSFGRRRVYLHTRMYSAPIKEYHISTIWIMLFILFEMAVAFFMLKYARDVSRAFYGSSGSITKAISNLNSITKNRGEEFRNSNVHASIIYVAGWPLCIAFNLLLSTLAINNYVITKRIPVKMVIPYIIMILMSFFLGSRSTAFRFITIFVFEYITIRRWGNKSHRKGQMRMFARLLLVMSVVVVALGFSINLIGRSTSIPLFEYVTAYVGAPFYNLDIAINNGIRRSEMFGQETFHHLYKFLGSRLGIKEWDYVLNIPYQRYHGKYLGNVYTMYFMYLEDFGAMGVVVLTSIVAAYYNFTYRRIIDFNNEKSFINMKFFMYCYLFNDLLMLTFSNRFFETAMGTTGILMLFWLIIVWALFKRGFFTQKMSRARTWGGVHRA